jgi:hypothetical protein
MKSNIARLVSVVAILVLGLTTMGCADRNYYHGSDYRAGGYYHSPHAYRRASHHVHYSGCGHYRDGVSYHYY